ncbi:NAD(P)H-binding protein [Vibrio tubiashii]|uniref:NAD(P)H-binding protein n=1 Tax=Vibrio tubiashii TaxID=29498 RepID=UPI00234ED3DD|nr:NAD(P)H-binding protein [Vibrio tubiashii]WCP69557.1 NAD(P)H-binding protein [Vibrio tubiashii]
MKILVLGATGATGKLVVSQLLEANHHVVALVRDINVLVEHSNLTQYQTTALAMPIQELEGIVAECQACVCCLGHNLTLQGVYGTPRLLVRDSILRIASVISPQRNEPLKLALMGSTGVSNHTINEQVSRQERLLCLLLRALLPPHRDNEKAAELLSRSRKLSTLLEWVILRPDTLIDRCDVSPYSWHNSPTRSALFNAGETSRINVANALTRLVTDSQLWLDWRGEMPVIYNVEAN